MDDYTRLSYVFKRLSEEIDCGYHGYSLTASTILHDRLTLECYRESLNIYYNDYVIMSIEASRVKSIVWIHLDNDTHTKIITREMEKIFYQKFDKESDLALMVVLGDDNYILL